MLTMNNIEELLNQITVVDDFFTTDEMNNIKTKLQEPKWSFVGGGVDDIDQSIKSNFWHMEDLDDYFSNYLFNKILEKYKFSVKLLNVYANGQTASQSGVPHWDEGDLTFLLFTENWKHHWGGNLNFCDNEEVTKVVTYKQNRGVLFPARFLHYAGAPDKIYDGLRISVAWKIKIESEI